MKTKLGVLIFLIAAVFARASTLRSSTATEDGQTNNLTALLQKGLFEEQANRNLNAAISDYQSLAAKFDQDRKLAATAIFRLGECYRMQGKTNEAAAQYQRILREFPDEKTLASLSRQNLAGMGIQARVTFSAARQRQIELLEKQIALAQTNLATVQERFRLGKATRSEVTAAEQQAVQLQITLAGLNANPVVTLNSSPSTGSAEDREIQRIQQMIQNSPDLINAPIPSDSTRTPLIKAAFLGWLKVAAYLLDHGADINRAASQVVANRELAEAGRVSPLLATVAAGNKTMTQFLIDRGANVNFQDSKGDTPLHFATELGFQAVAEVLVANKANVNAENNTEDTPLHLAVNNDHPRMVKMLLAHKAKINSRDKVGNTPLLWAAIDGHAKIVQMLLNDGANPNLENNQGRTPLSYAAEAGSLEMLKMLLAAKADSNAGKLDAPLLCAIHKNDVTSAELLLQAGANPNVKGKVDWQPHSIGYHYEGAHGRGWATPLWLAVDMNQLPMVKLLLKFKADPNDSLTDGNPILFYALHDTNIFAALLDAGGKSDAHSIEGQPLLNAAVIRTNIADVQLLLKHGANPNMRSSNGFTPLQLAAANLADRKIFELLLDHNANPNVRNAEGKTPLDYLKEKLAYPIPSKQKDSIMQLADLLREHGALDNLPHWDSIRVGQPASDHFATVFRTSTNDWNHFTLLETILNYYENDSVGHGYTLNKWTQYPHNPGIPFPNLAKVVILRPSRDSTNVTRIKIDLLNNTNGIDCSKDVPVKFGDVVEILEREHTLAEADSNGPAWIAQISECLRKRAGAVKLIVAGGQTVEVQLDQFGPLDHGIGEVLNSPQARNVLTSDSDLSRVKVMRRDVKTGKTNEWVLNCTGQQSQDQTSGSSFQRRLQAIIHNASETLHEASGLWLRNGDVIEVPEK